MSAGTVRALLSAHGLRAHRDLGQNFLIDDSVAARLVELSDVGARDWVIEIGTGLGALTRALAARAARVVTLEIDSGLVRALRAECDLPSNVELIHGDALVLDLAALVSEAPGPVRLVANLPYSVSTPLLRRLLDLRYRLESWSVMLQSEVARRLLAETGTSDYGSLAVLHRLTVSISTEMELSPNCFFPAPNVDSTFVRLSPLRESSLQAGELEHVERIVRAAFSKRRKTLVNSLRSGGLGESVTAEGIRELLFELSIDPRVRAERVEPEQHLALARALASGI
ncbi:MAG: 16S rRNA (adenine(1518)-N(6)/adenine(1519)-N(6))-dimethyltransferase RsmA [Myxococcota bacterium]